MVAYICKKIPLFYSLFTNPQAWPANKLLGYIRRNARYIRSTWTRRTLYLGLVCAHFAYANQVWAPQAIELISKLEKIQRRATKFILHLPFITEISD